MHYGSCGDNLSKEAPVSPYIFNDPQPQVVPTEEYKMVLCVRTDLGMSVGKIASQCSHATLGIFVESLLLTD